MLEPAPADIGDVVHRALNLFSLFCCAMVCASFLMFARDQVAGASRHQQAELVGSAPEAIAGSTIPRRPVIVPKTHQPRAFIDGMSGALTSPFDNIVNSNNAWVQHGIPALLALIVYGMGFGFISRYAGGGV